MSDRENDKEQDKKEDKAGEAKREKSGKPEKKEKHKLATEDELDAAIPKDNEVALTNEKALLKANQLSTAKQEGADPNAAHGPSVDELKGPPPKGGAIFPLGIILIIVAAIGVFLIWSRKARAEKNQGETRTSEVSKGPLIRVVKVQQQPALRTVNVPGEVHAWQQATLYAKVSGYLKTIIVDKGDHVQQNQLLATLESPETDQQVDAAVADLNLKTQAAKRAVNLSRSGVVSDQDLENAQAAEEVSQASLRRLRALKGYEEIRAPFTGVVTQRYVDVGTLLPAATGSTQSAQPVVDIADISRVRIWAYLGQDDAAQVKRGDVAKVTFDPRPQYVREATVARVAQSLDTRTRTMLTEFVLDNRDAGDGADVLYAGEFVHLALVVTARATPVIPSEALIVRSGKLFVAVIDNNVAHFRPVEISSDDGRTLQVSTGLQGGEMVAINAAGEMVDNGPVRIDEKNSQTGAVAPPR